MSDTKKINPLLKMGLELGPIVAFFVAYLRLRDKTFLIGGTEYEGFILVTAGFIPLMILSTTILWKLTGHLSKMQIATLVLVVIFGGLSVWLNDDRFFKMKPTMIYLLFGGALGIGLLRGQSYLRYVMEEMVPLTHGGGIRDREPRESLHQLKCCGEARHLPRVDAIMANSQPEREDCHYYYSSASGTIPS